ncbi:EthD domain-containing protein [Flavisphingomonas formosensis]|uniref:EthD domain-containing protein n=1 Tax=Flavisphingomonas formosensis TaxID=861534 RepID=UPI0012F7F1D1|nr:EthD domain-containing protein [Sphingomonas formosensis]
MEKLIYALWRDPAETRESFNARLKNEIAPKLAGLVKALRINIQDEPVSGGNSPRFVATDPQMEAVVQIWVDTAYDPWRAPIDALIGEAGRWEAWLVAESNPLPNDRYPPEAGKRTEGFSQIVFLTKPAHLEHAEWRAIWQGLHTAPAIDTQDTFEYVQNLIVRPLTAQSAGYVAIIEECFPYAALNDQGVYYDAPGQPEKQAANYKAMMDSCARFIGDVPVDCMPTSQYDVKPLPRG